MRQLTPVADDWLGRPLAETRWLLEVARFLVDPVAYGRGVPRGDGRTVVVVPGFMASDNTLLLPRRWLRAIGYRPRTADFIFNVDCSGSRPGACRARGERGLGSVIMNPK